MSMSPDLVRQERRAAARRTRLTVLARKAFAQQRAQQQDGQTVSSGTPSRR